MKSVHYVDDFLIPDDGSKEVIRKIEQEMSKDTEIFIYPDVHKKKGNPVVNGLLLKSKSKIYPTCLGVENCGYTVGKIIGDYTNEELCASFAAYVAKVRCGLQKIGKSQLIKMFKERFRKDFEKKKDLYAYLEYKSFEQLWADVSKILQDDMLGNSSRRIGKLGGGNHFFELHNIEKSMDSDIKENEKWFIVHSDSIDFGTRVYKMYSNLEIYDGHPIWRRTRLKLSWRKEQIKYFYKDILKKGDLKSFYQVCFSRRLGRTVDIASPMGKKILLDFNVVSVFGEMNREYIIKQWASKSNMNIEILFSHSHDSVTLERTDDCRELHLIHRGGVQYIGRDSYYMLPGAMGTPSYIMKNTYNTKAHLSANHGVGRVADKHIARELYSNKETVAELKERNISIYRIGDGNIAEQNLHAFKDVPEVIEQMEKYNLGKPAAITNPIAVIKG